MTPETEVERRRARRVPAWKILAGISGAFLVIVVAFFLWIHAAAERRWADMEKKARALLDQTRARDASRPVLRGLAVPGNAWDDYDSAIKDMNSLKRSDSVLGDFIARGPKADRAAVETLLAAHGAALGGLRRGAARAEGQYPLRWEDGSEAKLPSFLKSQRLANLAGCQARLLAEAGRSREAAELLLDTCQFGHDMGFNQVLFSEMIALAIYGVALEELKDLVLSGKLSTEDLTEVDRELELIDGHFPRNGHSMMNEAVMTGFGFLKTDVSGVELLGMNGTAVPSLMSWRYGFSVRLMIVDAFEIHMGHMRRSAESDDKPWPEVSRIGKEMQGEIGHLKNPIARSMLPGLSGANRPGREKRAQLRLLRVAVRFRATGEVPDLDDPFGGKLQTSKTGGRLKVWSVGKDGVDDGGDGGWKPVAGKEWRDIVLEVTR